MFRVQDKLLLESLYRWPGLAAGQSTVGITLLIAEQVTVGIAPLMVMFRVQDKLILESLF